MTYDEILEEPAWLAEERAELADHLASRADHLDAGGTLDELEEIEDLEEQLQNEDDDDLDDTTWMAIDLAPFVNKPTPVPEIGLERIDGVKHLYRDKIHLLFGSSESAKSWIAYADVAAVLLSGGRAVFIDFEDDEKGCIDRLRALGVPLEILLDRSQFRYVHPEKPLHSRDNQGRKTGQETRASVAFRKTILEFDPDLVVIDAMGEAMQREGLDPISADNVIDYVQNLVKPIIRETNAAVVIVDHTAHEARSRDSYGSVFKRTAIHVSYRVEMISLLRKADGGNPVNASSLIWVAKDRPAGVRPKSQHEGGDKFLFGTARFTAWPDGGVTLKIEPSGDVADFGNKEILADVLAHLTVYDGAIQTQIVGSLNRRKDDVAAACKFAANDARRFITIETKGRSHYHFITDAGRRWLEEQGPK